MRNQLTLAAALALSGCACLQTPAQPQVVYRTQTIDTGCQWTAPVTMTEADAASLPDDVAQQILAHNLEWRKRCASDGAAQ